jgi:transcription-repair coupling factor (superfamily II helicase)
MNGLEDFTFKDEFNSFKVENSSIPLFLALKYFKSPQKRIAFFAKSNSDVEKIEQSIKSLNTNILTCTFPSFDCSFFSNLSPTIDNKRQRIKTLYNLYQNKEMILISSLESLVEKTISKKSFINSKLVLSVNSDVNYTKIIEYLKKNNFELVDFVTNAGEYSRRGEIIDIFSPLSNYSVRVFFHFENIEKIKKISINTQETSIEIDKYEICPPSEFIFNDENISHFRKEFRELELINKDDYYQSISEKNIIEGSEQFFPILNKSLSPLTDYMKGFELFFYKDYKINFNKAYNDKLHEYEINKEYFLNDSSYLLNFQNLDKSLKNFKVNFILDFSIFTENILNFSDQILLPNKREDTLKLINTKGNVVIFCFDSITNQLKFQNFASLAKKPLIKINNLFRDRISFGYIYFFNLKIEQSFKVKYQNIDINFISDKDIFEKVTQKRTQSSKDNSLIIKDFSKLKSGDLVVHIDHGVGQYIGLKTTKLNDIEYEFIEILYHSNDKLFIPIQNLELISKYGDSDGKVILDKLGLSNWQKKKAKIKNKIKDIANDLINVAAKRALDKGEVIDLNSFEYEKFSSQFEFTETSDQIKTINQIREDLYSGQPMDRLVCGDVGFGKTEIAMRASFMCLSAGYQVVMICPKVLLVNQHFKTFSERFKKFNYRISKISRFESNKEKKKIKEELTKGKVNLLISTHAIFANDVRFQKLGLIIIDEEQSFGVEQKEKLKKFKPSCHVLTLTATPIPRTLQSSIFKIKDISLIQTPPVNRLNIKTYLMIEDLMEIKKIISNEINRNGQVFYVAPRISDLDSIKKKILKTIPNIRLACIHGKLNSSQIEKIYSEFFNNNIDVLLSTAMIESGLDLSNVNTIIIEKPQLFGLSQLYQLRGRVGRSSIQAYAYLIVKNIQSLSGDAVKKLKIISKIDKLGAGLSIASNDLSIRGAGNIIGSEQSGHIKEVGVELYYKMVQETINELKNILPDSDNWSPNINLGFSINISDNYIKDSNQRLSLYRELSNIKDLEQLEKMRISLLDKYGVLSKNLKNLLLVIEIKIMAKELLIKKIDDTNIGFVLEFKSNTNLDVSKILDYARSNPSVLELKPKSKLIFRSNCDKIKKVIDLKKFLEIIKTNFYLK